MTAGNLDHISEQEFVDIWGGTANSNGELFLHREVVEMPSHRVWTVYEEEQACDGGGYYIHWHAMPGITPSIALGYLISGKEWDSTTPHAIWYWDDDREAAIERVDNSDRADH